MTRPLEAEYAPFYRGYVAHVGEEEILPVLRSQLDHLDVLLGQVTPERETYAYAEGGFDEKEYLLRAPYNQIDLEDLLSELRLARLSNIAMLRNLDEQAWMRVGTANDAQVSVRALAFIMAGHVRHHMGVLRERYLADPVS